MDVSNPRQQYCNYRCLLRAGAIKRAEDADPDLGRKIRDARLALRLQQYKVAQRIGISNVYLAAIECGRSPLTPEIRERLFAVLGLDAEGNSSAPPLARFCKYCGGPIPDDAHQLAKFCSFKHERKFHAQISVKQVRAKRAAKRAERPQRFCALDGCDNALPDGAPLTRLYCCKRCTNRAFGLRQKKKNGHDDAPFIDHRPDADAELEHAGVRREHPEMTERQALQEARRRSWRVLVALADARESRSRRARLGKEG